MTYAFDRLLRARPESVPAWMPWVLGGVFVLLFMFRDYLMCEDGVIDNAVFWGRDYINVWTGGHLVRESRLDVLYDLSAYAAYQRELFGDIGAHNYSYPPVSYPLAAFFSLFPYSISLALWLATTGAFFIWSLGKWWPDRAGWRLLALLTPAAIVNIWAGHYGFLTGGLFLLGWRLLDEKPIGAGICFGLMLIKPHLAVLIPLVLALRGDWRAILSAALTVGIVVLATGLAYGWTPWAEYLLRTSGVQAAMIDSNGMFFRLMSPSMMSAVMEKGGGWGTAAAIHLLFAIPAIVMVVVAASKRVGREQLAFLVATCTFVVLPYAFNYDLTVVVIGALTLMTRSGVSGLDYRLAALGFMSPQLGMVLAVFGAPLMSLMLFGLAIAQFRNAMADAGELTRPDAPAAAGAAR